MKKAQGLSLNVIIVAAVVLIVLIVLWAIFTGKMGDFTKELDTKDPNTDPAVQDIVDRFKNNPSGTTGQTCTNKVGNCVALGTDLECVSEIGCKKVSGNCQDDGGLNCGSLNPTRCAVYPMACQLS